LDSSVQVASQPPVHNVCPCAQVFVQHLPALHAPPTHACPHAPQLALSLCSSTHAPLHIDRPALHVQAPHWHALLHACDPFPSHACVAPGVHAPSPVHADHADHTPPLHVRACIPQRPHACVAAPAQTHCPAWQLDPLGHATSHDPQCKLLVCTSTHEPLHRVVAAPEQELVHDGEPPPPSRPPSRSTCAAPAPASSPPELHIGVGLVQVTPHAPQLVDAERSALHPFPVLPQSA
jgi:hypothetical protein